MLRIHKRNVEVTLCSTTYTALSRDTKPPNKRGAAIFRPMPWSLLDEPVFFGVSVLGCLSEDTM
jgi:hypothetical protein